MDKNLKDEETLIDSEPEAKYVQVLNDVIQKREKKIEGKFTKVRQIVEEQYNKEKETLVQLKNKSNQMKTSSVSLFWSFMYIIYAYLLYFHYYIHDPVYGIRDRIKYIF